MRGAWPVRGLWGVTRVCLEPALCSSLPWPSVAHSLERTTGSSSAAHRCWQALISSMPVPHPVEPEPLASALGLWGSYVDLLA